MPEKVNRTAGAYRRLAWSSRWRERNPWSIDGMPVPRIGRLRQGNVQVTAFGPLALITVFVDPERRALPGTAGQEGALAELKQWRQLAEELCTSVECAAEDVGGQRGALDIIRDMGALLSKASR